MKLEKLPPVLRTILVSDGTVTRFLEAYYGELIDIQVLLHQCEEQLPSLIELEVQRGETLLHRQILLRGSVSQITYGSAESWIRMDSLPSGVREELKSGQVGIGELLDDRRVESYREILRFWVEKDKNGELESCRQYRIWIQSQPTLLIVEKFPLKVFFEV